MDTPTLIKWANGVSGAMHFLIGIYRKLGVDSPEAKIIFNKIEECKNLRGVPLKILYEEISGRDMDRVVEICDKVPSSLLEEACITNNKNTLNNYLNGRSRNRQQY